MRMKNIILMVAVFITLNVNAKNTTCIVKGKSSKKDFQNVELFKIVNGSLVSHSKTEIDGDGNFAFMFVPQTEGFYYLGTEEEYNRIYVKKGDNINLEIFDFGYNLVGKNSRENKVLFDWYKMSKLAEGKSVKFWRNRSDFKDFFPLLESLDVESKEFAANIKTGNSFFDNLMKLTIKWDLEYYALTFLYTPRSIHPKESDYVLYYNGFADGDRFENELLLCHPYAVRYMVLYNMYYSNNILKQKPERGQDYLGKQLENIIDPVLKGEFVVFSCNRVRGFEQLSYMREKYGKYLITDSQKERFHAKELSLRTFAPGEKAVNFTYPDKEGKKVSLTDFKGKVVLVDVWATWCGPCKAQIPHLEKLEKEYHGKDIVFISVSVDEKKDKWLNMIKKDNLGGVQLWANGFSKICKDYSIKGIPRFMLFDKEGNIISVDAPRPSEPKLKELINKYL